MYNDLKTLKTNFDRLTRDYDKLEAISVQQKLECTYLQQRKQLTKVNIEMENHTHELWVQIQELKGELETLCKSPGKAFQLTYMDNQLKEFENLFIDNALFKV